jgi:CHAD domain-containing protein
MSFRLKGRGSLAAGLQRAVRGEFRMALERLDNRAPSQDAVHEARKSVKKIRSVLRLLSEDLGRDYDVEQKRLRSAAHALSTLRDVDATAETLQALHGRYPAVIDEAMVRRIGRGLRSGKREARLQSGRLAHRAQRAIRRSRTSVPDRIHRAASRAAIRAGLTRGYRRARQALVALSPEADAVHFHKWRRRVKDHSYHVRLFERLHSTPRARAHRLRDLDGWLGEDHNQALLRSAILAEPDRFGDARSTAVVLGCIAKHQAWLRRHALRLGRRLFSVKPAEFRKSAAAWWPEES